MVVRYLKNIFLTISCILIFVVSCAAYNDIRESQIKVTMRMIGHEVLLSANDSVSLILAIEKVENRYKIEFSSEFQFYPEDLVPIIDKNMKLSGIAEGYIAEVESCADQMVIYSYQIGNVDKAQSDMIPCKGRKQETGCYKLFITLLDSCDEIVLAAQEKLLARQIRNNSSFNSGSSESIDYAKLSLWTIPTILLFGFLMVMIRKKPPVKVDTSKIPIGDFVFDTKNMTLKINDNTTELTNKETELLTLLHGAANTTLEREYILKSVWGDEGDYIGRTLDVFISKLRKKLEVDTKVKIINIRGVGYKLVVND